MSQFRKDTQLTILSRIPVMLLSFISVVFLARLLGPDGYGTYTFVMAVLNLFLTVIGFQLEGAVPVFLAQEKSNKTGIITATGVLSLFSILVCAIVLTIIVFLVPDGRSWVIPASQSVPFFFAVLIVLFILRRTTTLILATFRGMFLFKAFNGYLLINQIIPALIYTILFLLTVTSGNFISLELVFKFILLIETTVLVIGLLMLSRNKILIFSNNYIDFIRPIYSFSIKNLVATTGHFLNKRLDVWFVQFYRGSATLGQYGLASQVTNFISDAMTPLNHVMIPYLSGSPKEAHKAIVERTARLNFTIALLASIGIIGTSWLFIPIFFGLAFSPAIPASRILAIGIIFVSQRLVMADYFKAVNLLRYPAIAAWSGVIITIVLDIVLIPVYGIEGAAWATTFAYATTALYLLVKAKRQLGFSLINIMVIQPSDIKWLLLKK